MNGTIIENVNDILSLLTLGCVIGVPLFYVLKAIYASYRRYYEKRIERLMKEEDWHM